MREPEIPSDPDRVACKVCFKEIPLFEAVNEEATDYVLHFCGIGLLREMENPGKGLWFRQLPRKKVIVLKGKKRILLLRN
jgi:hypothetical protein